MNVENAKRLARSIRRLLPSLDTDAKCYRYQHDPEFTEVKSYLIHKANQLDPDRAIPQAKMDWRERRDALVAEYLERNGGNPRAAYDAINVALDAMAPPIEDEVILDYLSARDELFRRRVDPTGVLLTPSLHGIDCAGRDACCDECDHYLDCFSEHE